MALRRPVSSYAMPVLKAACGLLAVAALALILYFYYEGAWRVSVLPVQVFLQL